MPRQHKAFGMLPEIYHRRSDNKKFLKAYVLKSDVIKSDLR